MTLFASGRFNPTLLWTGGVAVLFCLLVKTSSISSTIFILHRCPGATESRHKGIHTKAAYSVLGCCSLEAHPIIEFADPPISCLASLII